MDKFKSEVRLKNMAWAAVILLLISVLLYKWQQIENKAEDTQLILTQNNLYQGAVNLKQQWEINNKPYRDHINGIDFQYTPLGWPIVNIHNQLDCHKLWQLLTNNIHYSNHNESLYVTNGKLTDINHCTYIINNKALAIFYIGGKIRIVI
ncbi:hypothetical protein [uncultured Photobacterium sp.]|uniref:hypothetical protein n=1 Tax=uncultured Photobacterium sp. TaxID=173973 RepID=UPI0026250F41|nr:hypothetical protein [uncultured Photobacterium sp.]